MIQRIQSVFLLMVVVLAALLFVFPIADYFSDTTTLKLMLTGVDSYVPKGASLQTAVISPYLVYFNVLVNLAVAATAGFAIFQYKQRPFQVKLVRIALLVDIVLLVVLFVITDFLKKKLQVTPDYGIGILFPLISVVFLVLAQRSILKDERLVKSTDRLR
jgi:hypothetical protein